MQISELATLTAGIITSRVLAGKHGKTETDEDKSIPFEQTIKVLIPKAIHDNKVDHELLAEEELVKEVSPDFLTQEGDLIIKFSSPYDSCLIEKEDEGLLIPSFCCKIRIKDFTKTDKHFLLAYLNSGKCKNELKSKCYGSVMAITKKSDVMKIEVPEFSEEEQKKIGSRFVTVMNIKKKMDEYIKLEQDRLDAVFGEKRNDE